MFSRSIFGKKKQILFYDLGYRLNVLNPCSSVYPALEKIAEAVYLKTSIFPVQCIDR